MKPQIVAVLASASKNSISMGHLLVAGIFDFWAPPSTAHRFCCIAGT
jgi:hypothetical protein